MATDQQQPLLGVSAALANSPPARTILSTFLLIDRVALVTGGHRGIGIDIALALAEAGATVYCVARQPSPNLEWLKVQAYAANLPDIAPGVKNKGRLEYISGDVANQEQIWAIAEDIVKKEGRLDICFANAGVANTIGCLECSAEELRKVMSVNVDGALFTAQAAGRQMVKFGIPGSIIIIASTAARVANFVTPNVAYTTSKAAETQMARSMACELGPKKIRVNTLSPGIINTELSMDYFATFPEVKKRWEERHPLGRFGRTDEMVGAALWLASDASTFCTGSDIIVDGGQRAW